MRNLRKFTAVVIAIALVLTSMTAAFAATTPVNADKAATLKDLGLYAGTDANDVAAGLDGALTTQDSLIFLAKLFGYNEDAAKLSATDVSKALAKFADAGDIAGYAKNVVAYSAINGILSGSTKDGKFFVGAKDTVTAARFATFMLKQMGYTVPTFTAAVAQIAEVDGSKVSATETGDLTRDAAVGMMYGALTAKVSAGATVIAGIVGDDAALKATAEKAGLFADPSVLAVSKVTASSAKTFKVVFSKAVADVTKLAFEVKRSTTAVTITASWNDAKTEATLTAASNLPEGAYTVAVKNDTADLGTSNVTITAQKIAKIDITSTKLSVIGTGLTGYATYKVYDQYNNDITASYLASNVTFQTGVGTITKKNGVLTITSANSLIQFANVVITGYDTTSGVSASATLATSTALGTLSDLQLGTISNVNNKVLTAGDVTSVFYISYTALDMSGNDTKNYDLVKGGLILSGANSDEISVSNPNVKAKIVQDPADSSKAAIELKVTTTDSVLMDMPLAITSMTFTGKTSTINATLKKAAEVETFTLMTPEYNIAVGDTGKAIPFEAYDQNGTKITKYDDLFAAPAKVTLSGGIAAEKNVDGTAKVVITPIGSDGPQIISANVARSGKISTLTISVQKAAVADKLVLDTSVFVAAMEHGATQPIDFGYDVGGLKVKDQFDRDINMTSGNNLYAVAVTSTGDITVGGSALLKSGKYNNTNAGSTQAILGANAVNGGSGTVTFTLFKDLNADGVQQVNGPDGNAATTADNEPIIDVKSASLSVIKSGDISSFTIDEVTDAIYAGSNDNAHLTARDKEYAANPKVYGKTGSGAKVLLAGTPVNGAYVDNGDNFVVTAGATGGNYKAVKVTAAKIADAAKTSATTTLTVSVSHSGISAVTTTIKSSTAAPVAATMGVDVENFIPGLSVDGDVVTLSVANFAGAKFVAGVNTLAKFDTAGSDTNKSNITIYAKDQYGKKAIKLSQFTVVSGTAPLVLNSDGSIASTAGIAAGQDVTISAVTSNGLVKTIKIVFVA